MSYSIILNNKKYIFKDIKSLMACANEEKSGDRLAGIAAADNMERSAAKSILADVTMHEIRENPIVPYESDEITRMDQDGLDKEAYDKIKGKTVGEFREWLLSDSADESAIKNISGGLTAEMVAAVAKLMSNMDLVYAANKIRIESRCVTTIGSRGVFATRLQPNHPTDDIEGITASLYEGLSYGCGDALIGLNPVNGSAYKLSQVLKRFQEIKEEFSIPTQICVLGHITTQIQAIKEGAPTDLVFQSIAGSEKGNREFGFGSNDILEAMDLVRSANPQNGPNCMYFETGQGSELSSNSHFGGDQLTMEARCYAFARKFSPFLVNTVVGFIGPEYLYDSKQVIRAGLEDHFMAKLMGLPMGCDCCYTNHMKADQNDIENLSLLLALSGVNYVIGVPAGDDIMLNYQTNSYHDAETIRRITRTKPIPEFERWLEQMGIMEHGRLTSRAGDATIFVR